eukprot:c3713_g1_i1 orf=449-1951(-)
MSSDHPFCASSPRGGAGGLCKALKEMKTKVATHTGMSLSFVELIATSPVVGLLPALPPSPRSPSALLHRHMHHHSNYSLSHVFSVAKRSSSSEQSSCANMEMVGRQSSCVDMETVGRQSLCADMEAPLDGQSSCATAIVDGEDQPGLKLSCTQGLSSSSCNVSCGCHVSCENPSSSISCNQLCGHPSSSTSCNLSCTHLSSHASKLCISDGGGSDVTRLPCRPSFASSVGMCGRGTNICEARIPSIIARVLYFIITLIFCVSSIIKSFYMLCPWGGCTGRRAVHPQCNEELSGVDDQSVKVDAGAGKESSQVVKTSCKQRSKLLKSKLRSSFRSLSVQVPRKAFAPLHLNTFPLSSSSTSSSSPSSSSSSNSPALNSSPAARKSRTLRSPAFACKLTKSFNQRHPFTGSLHTSPISPTIYSSPSLCDFKEHYHNSPTSLSKMGDSMVASLVAFPLALCGLLYSKVVAGIAVTAWLLIFYMARSASFLWRRSPPKFVARGS